MDAHHTLLTAVQQLNLLQELVLLMVEEAARDADMDAGRWAEISLLVEEIRGHGL